MEETGVTAAVTALKAGQVDDAIARLEALADRGLLGAGVAYDRGLAYAARAKSVQAVPGDLGRAAHAFEEAIRRDPRDANALAALDAVRHEIARRNARSGGRTEEVGTLPTWRTIAVAAPADVWAGFAIGGSVALALALAARPRLARAGRLAASTIALVGLFVAVAGSALALGARHLRLHVREAVVIAPSVVAIPDEGGHPLDLSEGARVDVVEERATTTRVHTSKGEGWVARDAIRLLPPWRP